MRHLGYEEHKLICVLQSRPNLNLGGSEKHKKLAIAKDNRSPSYSTLADQANQDMMLSI